MAASVNSDEDNEQEPLLNVGNNSTSKSEHYSYQYEDKLPDGRTSVVGAAFIVGNAAIGGGLLAVPYAFYSAGGAIGGSLLEAVSSCKYKHNISITDGDAVLLAALTASIVEYAFNALTQSVVVHTGWL